MKSKTLIYGIVFLVLLSFAFATDYEKDTFEDGASTGWTEVTGSWAVNSTDPLNGTYSYAWASLGTGSGYKLAEYTGSLSGSDTIAIGDSFELLMRKTDGVGDQSIRFYGTSGAWLEFKLYSDSQIRTGCSGASYQIVNVGTGGTNDQIYRGIVTQASSNSWDFEIFDDTDTSIGTHTISCTLGSYFTKTDLRYYDHTDVTVVTVDDISIPVVAVIPVISSFFEVTAKDVDTASTLYNITVTLENGSTYTNATNAVVYTPFNDSSLQNFTVSVDNYFNQTFTDYNTSVNLQANLTGFPLEDFSLLTPTNNLTNASEYNITWNEANSPTGKVVNYNVSILYTDNLTYFQSFTTTNLYYNVDLSGYTSDNFTVLVNATETGTNGTFKHNSTLTVDRPNYLYFFNELTEEIIIGANITIDFPNATDLTLVTDSEGKVQFNSYQNGTIQKGNYSITFEDFIGYVTPITFSEVYNDLPINETFNITVTNINVSIFFRSNFTTFNREATVIIEGVDNYTTTNGSIFIQNATISDGEYRITVSADGFFNEEKTFTYTGQEGIAVNIYMLELNNSNSGTVTVRTIDDFSKLLSGSQVNLLEYDTSTLSYIEVSECFTDSNGECKFLVETNTKSYKFTASRVVNGQTITASTGSQIFEDDISGGEIVLFSEETITLTLSSQEQYGINVIQNIIFNVTESFSNVTNQSNIDVSFRSIDGTTLTVCVEYFQVEGGIKTSLTGTTFCVSGSSGEVTENAYFTLNMSKDYIAEVYITSTRGKTLIDSFRYSSDGSFLDRLENNATLPYFVLFIWIVVLGFGVMMKNVPFVGISIIVGAWIIWGYIPTIFFMNLAVLQTILGVLILYVGRKKEDFT